VVAKVFAREFRPDEVQFEAGRIVVLKLSAWDEVVVNFDCVCFYLAKIWKHYILGEPIDRFCYPDYDTGLSTGLNYKVVQ